MNGKLAYALVALVCASFFSSCVPYDENGNRINKKPQAKKNGTVTDPKQQEIEAKREELRKKEEARKKQQAAREGRDEETPTRDKPTEDVKRTTSDVEREDDGPTPPKPTTPKNHPVAAKVPGKEGFVFSPFNNKVVDVRNIASGTLVADPQYPASEKKHFRVP